MHQRLLLLSHIIANRLDHGIQGTKNVVQARIRIDYTHTPSKLYVSDYSNTTIRIPYCILQYFYSLIRSSHGEV